MAAASNEPPQLSVLIIARDAAADLNALLNTLAALDGLLTGVMEVVVLVDDRTQDNTARVASQHNTIVHSAPFRGFGAFKELGRRRCRGRWLLNLDVDERPEVKALEAIACAVNRDAPFGYSLDLRTYLGGIPTRRGPFSAERRVRLFPRALGHWDIGARVHETPCLSVPVRKLAGKVRHLSFVDSADCIDRFEHYGRQQASERSKPGSRVRAISRASWRVTRYLFVHGGLLRGSAGFTMAFAIGRGTYLKWSLNPAARDVTSPATPTR